VLSFEREKFIFLSGKGRYPKSEGGLYVPGGGLFIALVLLCVTNFLGLLCIIMSVNFLSGRLYDPGGGIDLSGSI